MHIAPGEPVPPGMENEVKPAADLQFTIDKFKEGPMVGLEYIMELTSASSKEPSYHCVLCDKRGDPRTIVVHITGNVHRVKFLVMMSSHFYLLRFYYLFIFSSFTGEALPYGH